MQQHFDSYQKIKSNATLLDVLIVLHSSPNKYREKSTTK